MFPWLAVTMFYIGPMKVNVISEDGKEYVLERGDMLLLEPDKNHIGFKEHFCDYYFIHLNHMSLQSMIARRLMILRELSRRITVNFINAVQ